MKRLLVESRNYILALIILIGLLVGLEFTSIPERKIDLLEKLLASFITITIALYISNKLTRFIKTYVAEKTGKIIKVGLIHVTIKVLVFIVAFLVILSIFKVNIAPILTTLGIAGLAVSLALRETLENFFAGFHLMMTKELRPGDLIRLESGEEGYIEDITWRTVTVRTTTNNYIIVPNAKLARSQIVNYTLPTEKVLISVEVTVDYNNDLAKVEEVTLEEVREIVKTHPDAVNEGEPIIRYRAFKETGIVFTVLMEGKNSISRLTLPHELIKRLHRRYKEEGIIFKV